MFTQFYDSFATNHFLVEGKKYTNEVYEGQNANLEYFTDNRSKTVEICSFYKVIFSDLTFGGQTIFQNCSFVNCTFFNVSFSEAGIFSRSEFTNCSFSNFDLTKTALIQNRFHNCTFNQVNLHKANLFEDNVDISVYTSRGFNTIFLHEYNPTYFNVKKGEDIITYIAIGCKIKPIDIWIKFCNDLKSCTDLSISQIKNLSLDDRRIELNRLDDVKDRYEISRRDITTCASMIDNMETIVQMIKVFPTTPIYTEE